MKVVFIGTVQTSKVFLEKTIECGADVVGVCTKNKSKFNSDFVDITPVCRKNDIEYRYVDDINSEENISWISSLKPDFIFCFGWSFLIKEKLLSIPKHGVIGFHPAELPRNRGRHPLIWSIFLGLKQTASTFFFMDSGADTGDILSQSPVDISPQDDAGSLYDKVCRVASKQIEEFIPLLKSGNYTRKKQNHDLANSWRKRKKPDGKIDFRMNSNSVCRLVRALTKPYVGAHVEWMDNDVKIWEAVESHADFPNLEPGKILSVKNEIITVKTYDSAVMLLKHDFKGILPKAGDYL